MKRLEEDGFVRKRVALLSEEALGLGVTVFVAIKTNAHNEEWLTTFAEGVRALIATGIRVTVEESSTLAAGLTGETEAGAEIDRSEIVPVTVTHADARSFIPASAT